MFGSLGAGNLVRTIITFCGLNPSCTLRRSQKLRRRRPAATISTKDKANSVMTRPRRVRARSADPVEARPSCLSAWIKSTWLACNAGAKPKNRPETTQVDSAKSKMLQLIDISFRRGKFSGTSRNRESFNKNKIATPATPPNKESSRLSVSNCRVNRHFASSHAGTGKQKIRNIDAGNQENQSDGGQEQHQRLANVANHPLFKRQEPNGPRVLWRIITRQLLLQRCGKRIQLLLCYGNCYSGL